MKDLSESKYGLLCSYVHASDLVCLLNLFSCIYDFYSASTTVTDEAESISLKSAKTNMFDQARMMSSSAQTMGASFSEDQLHVNTVSLVGLNAIKHCK